jgi:hypothetical protein
VLKAAIEAPGLRDFLLAEPVLDGAADLGPYLFLSQTALAADRPAQIQSPDEAARALAARIESDDRIRSKAAILQARRQDAVIIDSVVRQLRTDLLSLTDPRRQVHAVGGLLELCAERPSNYPGAVEALAQLDPSSNQALALPAISLLDAAERAGIAGAATLKQTFAGTSTIVAALAKKPRRGRG